ncbi:hypothetical protein, partial [Escherichia coli]|uniref:hypothetical protein n=1 Tax=Escherichia coli TaxID=562 RepID=UPI003016E34F
TGFRTENIPPFNPLTHEDNELIMVFNGDRNVPADRLKPQPLILPDHRYSYMANSNTVSCTEKYSV